MSKKQKMTAVVLSQEKIAEDIYSMWRSRGSPGTVYLHVYE